MCSLTLNVSESKWQNYAVTCFTPPCPFYPCPLYFSLHNLRYPLVVIIYTFCLNRCLVRMCIPGESQSLFPVRICIPSESHPHSRWSTIESYLQEIAFWVWDLNEFLVEWDEYQRSVPVSYSKKHPQLKCSSDYLYTDTALLYNTLLINPQEASNLIRSDQVKVVFLTLNFFLINYPYDIAL